MSQPSFGKKLGFVLSNLKTDSVQRLFDFLVANVVRDDNSFFVFPLGAIAQDGELYHSQKEFCRLINSYNIDGLISWASSFADFASEDKIEEFHKNHISVPFITVGQKVNGQPCVCFDLNSGVKKIISHFIEAHSAKRIAFLCGSDGGDFERKIYLAYKDALTEAGLSEIIYNEGLEPVKDFDAIISPNDSAVCELVARLRSSGFKIPREFVSAGFGDTYEAKISNLTTIKFPFKDAAAESYRKLGEFLQGMLGIQDSLLQVRPVLRESCGCSSTKITLSENKKIRTREQFTAEVYKLFDEDYSAKKLESMIDALFACDRNKLYEVLLQNLVSYFEKGGEVSNIYKLASLLKSLACVDSVFVDKLVQKFMGLVPYAIEKTSFQKNHIDQKIYEATNSLGKELISVFDRKTLVNVLQSRLKIIGIDKLAIVLYDEDKNYSNYIGGFNDSGEIHLDELCFSREFLVPERYSAELNEGVFFVLPLSFGEKNYGYMVCNYSHCGCWFYENLRLLVSTSLHGIFMFDQVREEKSVAQKAEVAKTEFFANVGSELCDPLRNISAKIQQMEENLNKGIEDKEILSEQLLFLRSQIDSQLSKTETLVDLTRSQIEDLPLNKKLFEIRQILPGSIVATLESEFPLLYGDCERLKKAVKTISDFAEKTPFVSEKADGIHIEFYSNRFNWQKSDLLLAEKIILLHYGDVIKSTSYAEIILPWPSLVSQSVPLKDIEKAAYFSLSKDFTRKVKKDIPYLFAEKSEPSSSENMVLYWEPDSAPIDEWIKVYSLRHDEIFSRAPILCYSRNMIGHDFIGMIEQKIKSRRSPPVLVVGASRTSYGTWATQSNSVSISSMDEFDKILEEISPTIIVFEKIDDAAVQKVRQNPKTVFVPIFVILEQIDSEEQVALLSTYPKLILCNQGAADCEQFEKRVKSILAGSEILPPNTGAIVKKAILYLNLNSAKQILRWQLADSVHVSEDYITRIFHKELGLSMWEYLNRYRVSMAKKMILETNCTIYEAAEKTGFQDQAYFCRVFKKIYGVPPGKIRSK